MSYLLCIQVGLEAESEALTTYKNLLTKLPERAIRLEAAYAAIENLLTKASAYVDVSRF